jgi:hypothetical protein
MRRICAVSDQSAPSSVSDMIPAVVPSRYAMQRQRARCGPTPTMTSVPASENEESSSTTSGLFVVRVTSLKHACSAGVGILEEALGVLDVACSLVETQALNAVAVTATAANRMG